MNLLFGNLNRYYIFIGVDIMKKICPNCGVIINPNNSNFYKCENCKANINLKTNKIYCSKLVWDSGGFRRYHCRRYVWKDGYCKQHHPENVKKREEECRKKWEEQRKKSCTYRLKKATIELKEAKAEIKRLKGKINRLINRIRSH